MSEATKPNYKPTLNLPKTDFAMKANLAQNEPQSQKRWTEAGLYDRVQEARAGAPVFRFHDGPPYANGSIHVGHLLNKVLKDLVVRTRVMTGRSCPYVPGWDCHGLPIEHKVMTELVQSGKVEKLNTLTEDQRRMAIRRECRRSAEKFIKLQAGQMQRLMTLADYDHPYMTMDEKYEAATLDVFASLMEQGLVYRALKAVHWSIANETALAEAELEYEDREDPSIYVDFEALDREAVARAFGLEELDETPSFMIWTTTPWTLPANVAIAVNEEFEYVLARIDGNLTILAASLLEKVTKTAKAESVEVVTKTTGKKLVGLRYRHPFVTNVPACGLGRSCDPKKVWSLVAAKYVTLDDGTGLVHTAPGHGEDDYRTGVAEELPVYCPVQKDGTYDHTAPDWLRTKLIWNANNDIVEHLRKSGHLFHHHTFVHSYPHDWRSKTPVIFRATEQWFVGVDREFSGNGSKSTLRDMALQSVDAQGGRVKFVPEWGRNRMRGMLESRPDWCLSRQRSWGLPIPAFETRDGAVVMTPASVRAVAKRFAEAGSDAWFLEEPAQLLQHWNPKDDHDLPEGMRRSLDPSTMKKLYDIFDVWFEAGSSWNAVMRARFGDDSVPTDLYLEGSDQHRGWFQLSMLPALGVIGAPPYKTLLTHGFMVDKDGRKMSKSTGNALNVDDLLKDFGADVCRWWVSSLAYENDIKVDPEFFRLAGESYRKVRNTLRFLLSNLADFTPSTEGNAHGHCVDLKSIPPASLDAHLLAETTALQEKVLAAYEKYEFRKAHLLLFDFCNDTLSAFYCAAVKDRLYCDAADSPRRRRAQTVIFDVLEVLCRLLAPILPHTADEAYRALWRDESKCIHLQQTFTLECTPADANWPTVLADRERVLKALETAKANGVENPLDAEVVLPDSDGRLAPFAEELPDVFGVSRVSFDVAAREVVVKDLRDAARCDRCWKRTTDTAERADGGALCARCAEAVGV